MRHHLRPLKGRGLAVVDGHKSVDGLAQLLGGSEAGALQRLPTENAKPAFDLIEPRRVSRREVEMNLRMALQPAVILGFVGVEVIQHHVDLAVGVGGHQLVHEIQKFPPPAAAIVSRPHLASRHIQGGKQRRRAMALVTVTEAIDRFPIRQAQESLGPFQRLNGQFLVHAQQQRILGRAQVQAHDIGRLGSKLGIGADAPTAPSLQVDLVAAQHSPHLVFADILECCGQQRAIPSRVTFRRRLVQQRRIRFSTLAPYWTGLPERGASVNPDKRSWAKCWRHLETRAVRVCKRAAICTVVEPWCSSRII